MTDNAGLRGARQIASEKLASVSKVKIPGSDIIMGNVVPLKKQLAEAVQTLTSIAEYRSVKQSEEGRRASYFLKKYGYKTLAL